MSDILIPFKPFPANCGHCGSLYWSVFVEPVDKVIKGIKTKAGRLVKLECTRCKTVYELEDGHLGGGKVTLRGDKRSEQTTPISQEQVDAGKDLSS